MFCSAFSLAGYHQVVIRGRDLWRTAFAPLSSDDISFDNLEKSLPRLASKSFFQAFDFRPLDGQPWFINLRPLSNYE